MSEVAVYGMERDIWNNCVKLLNGSRLIRNNLMWSREIGLMEVCERAGR
jgi:hypothetical protein